MGLYKNSSGEWSAIEQATSGKRLGLRKQIDGASPAEASQSSDLANPRSSVWNYRSG
jgi:hypothetical protein